MTAPETIVCTTCEGESVIKVRSRFGRLIWAESCPDCCCSVCGEPTSTPPLCADHQREQDDREAAKAYREGRYE